jgi:hypothetical protein
MHIFSATSNLATTNTAIDNNNIKTTLSFLSSVKTDKNMQPTIKYHLISSPMSEQNALIKGKAVPLHARELLRGEKL